jgi:uncharacterized protein
MSQHVIRVGTAFLVLLLLGQSARAQTIEPAFRADIEKLQEITGSAALGTQLARLVSAQMLDNLKKARPDIPERAFAITSEVIEVEFSKAFTGPDGLNSRLVAIYAKHFTPDEVRGLLMFYGTDLGKKMITEMPLLLQEGAAPGQEWASANVVRIGQVIQARLKAEGFTK